MINTKNPSRSIRLALHLVAAKQDIVNMGFPEIISKLFYEKYGKLAPLIAKWYKQYHAPGSYSENPHWWSLMSRSYGSQTSLQSMTSLYENGVDPDSFIHWAEHEGIGLRYDVYTQEQVDEFRQNLVLMLREEFFNKTFFTYYPLMVDITSGSLTDVAPYKKLNFMAACIKYDKLRHFDQTTPLKVYDNGFKWVDTGKKSLLLSTQMHNCGSVGVMSMDVDRTILTLFGPTNKPHVMVTYSPNEKRLSGDECAGSSPVKPEYHDYVLDLARHLGVRFDEQRSKSTLLQVRYLLRDKAQSVVPLQDYDQNSHIYDEFFRFTSDGQEFYTNGTTVVSAADVARVQAMLDRGEINLPYPREEPFKTALNHYNREILKDKGIIYTSLNKFSHD